MAWSFTQIEATKYKKKHTPQTVINVVNSPIGALSGIVINTITL